MARPNHQNAYERKSAARKSSVCTVVKSLTSLVRCRLRITAPVRQCPRKMAQNFSRFFKFQSNSAAPQTTKVDPLFPVWIGIGTSLLATQDARCREQAPRRARGLELVETARSHPVSGNGFSGMPRGLLFIFEEHRLLLWAFKFSRRRHFRADETGEIANVMAHRRILQRSHVGFAMLHADDGPRIAA